jgi:putative salt-induced outer membrane protein YdiY
MLRPLLVFCTFLLAASAAHADEILLTNGDRITGTVVSLAGDTLTVDTAYGTVRIPRGAVAGLVVTDPILITIGQADPVEVRIAAGSAPGQVVLTPGGPTPLTQIVALARPQPPITVNGGTNAGFINTGGNTDVRSLRLDGDVVVRQTLNRYSAAGAINRASESDTETAENWNSAFNYDRFLTERLFLNGNAIFTNDRFRDLDLRTALGAGVGYQLLNTARATLTANAGLGWVNDNFEEGVDEDYTAARESAALLLTAIPGRVAFFHQHDGYFGIEGEDNLFFRTRNGVRLSIVAGFVTTLQHDLDYDRSPAPGRETTDRTLALTFGYRF